MYCIKLANWLGGQKGFNITSSVKLGTEKNNFIEIKCPDLSIYRSTLNTFKPLGPVTLCFMCHLKDFVVSGQIFLTMKICKSSPGKIRFNITIKLLLNAKCYNKPAVYSYCFTDFIKRIGTPKAVLEIQLLV